MTTGFQFKEHEYVAEFYRRRDEMGLTTEEECHNLLMTMAEEGKMSAVFDTKKTIQEWKDAKQKQGFKILDIKQEDER